MTVTENKAFGYSEKEMEELVRRTYPRMIQYVRHVLNSGVTVAEDVIYNVLSRLLEQKPGVMRDKIDSYLFRAVRNDCMNVISKRLRTGDVVSIENISSRSWEILACPEHEPEAWRLAGEREILLDDVMRFADSFSPRTRQIFYMSRIEGMKQEEIAAALGISTRAVRKHLKFTVEQFRRHFGKHGK